jgi:adenylate kinase
VLLLDVRNETLVQRLAGRRICRKCGSVYNVQSLDGATVCPKDGNELYQRPDDKEEVIARRLEVYEEQTRPLIDYYSRLGLLRVIAGEGELAEVSERMEAAALAKPVSSEAVKVEKRAAAKRAPAKRKPAARPAKAKGTSRSAAKSAKKTATKAAKKKAAKKKAVGKTAKNSARGKVARKAAKRRTPAVKRAAKRSAKHVRKAARKTPARRKK